MANFEWDDSEFPLGYLLTIRTFGTWLHGDDRYSVDRHGKNIYATPKISPNKNLSDLMEQQRSGAAFILTGAQRKVVGSAIRNVCSVRNYYLSALNVRTNHLHCVISAPQKPESIIVALQANATRELRAARLLSKDQSVWSRGGSRRYLWKPNHLEGAIEYVLYGQGKDLPNF